MHFADDGVARHISKFRGNLASRKSGFPEFLELFDAIVRPGQYRHHILSFASRRPIMGRRCDTKALKIPAGRIL
jgi:hypothetical protein